MTRFLSTRMAVIVLSAALGVSPIAFIGCQRDVIAHSPQLDAKGRKMLTPLMNAAGNGDLPSVEKLLRNDANVNATDIDGYTALHYAAHCGDIRVVRALLVAGADINARTKGNVTPLMNSVNMACGKPEITLSLIQSGADVNVADSNGETALWIATTESSPEVMEALLRKGADPDVQSKSLGFTGDTPLHMAASNGLREPVELLLRYGAKATIRNARGQTALDVVNEKWPEIRDLFAKHKRDNHR